MAARTLDHVNIRTPHVEETARFYAELLGMNVTPPPGQQDMAMGAWISDEAGRAVIHVSGDQTIYPTDGDQGEAPQQGSGRVHHIAFDCTDHAAMLADIEARRQNYKLNEVPQIPLRQIFLHDPNGILVELNFR